MEAKELAPDQVWTIDDFLSADECDAWVARAETLGFEDAPITTSAGFVHDKETRNNERAMFDDADAAAALWERYRAFAPSPSLAYAPCGLNERFRLYRYDPGQYFAPHFDGSFVRENGDRSRFTFMVYLNDGCEGGETRFYGRRGDAFLAVRPTRGMALVFVHAILHEGATLTRGRKYALRSDVMYRLKA